MFKRLLMVAVVALPGMAQGQATTPKAACQAPEHRQFDFWIGRWVVSPTGKDAVAGKGTFVTVLGLEGAKTRLMAVVNEAEQALGVFGHDGEILKMAARFVAERKA